MWSLGDNTMKALYDQLETGAWSVLDPTYCPCKGYGWMLSNLDTWHRCPYHGKGVPHPEAEAEYDLDAHQLRMYREAYVSYRDEARRLGFRGNFREACEVQFEERGEFAEPKDWTAAAADLVAGLRSLWEEAEAKRKGFTCALEMRMADEAA